MHSMTRQALLAALSLSISLPALADEQGSTERGPTERGPTERLEADLRALFADEGTLAIGEVEEALIRDRVTAHDLHFAGPDGQQLWLDRYVVSGDYDRPDEVRIEGIRLETPGREQSRLAAETLLLDAPSRAVLPLHEETWPADVTFEGLSVEALVAEFAGQELGSEFGEGRGQIAIERLQAAGVSRDALDALEVSGVKGKAAGDDEFGSGTFSLAFARVEGLRGLAGTEEDRELDRLEVRDLAIDFDRLVASLSSLEADGDMTDGEGGFRLEALDLDLARMIALAPEAERTRLRMLSNVLTDGSGRLRIDADSSGRWESGEAASRLLGELTLTAGEAFGWALDADLPVRLPEGVTPADFLAGMESLEELTLLGGRIDATLTDLGLFERLPTIMAASQGVSEAEFLAQARTQAQGFGMMLGPEIEALFSGMVAMMAGEASELAIALTLPAESELEALSADPLALPERLEMRVESR
ncbi:hypothetical protein RSO68_09550 [Halomonas saccharevitans]|uniref:AsmA protein n=1 Tax=Halomonas saccharevitans TaxID=416872 RepID=A0ABU3NEY1_9GAMM|nr:hypothetical protein [Halomonas saccharevitans]MDT8879717.1 hypothetical protein [Halomonas saccharevitans]